MNGQAQKTSFEAAVAGQCLCSPVIVTAFTVVTAVESHGISSKFPIKFYPDSLAKMKRKKHAGHYRHPNGEGTRLVRFLLPLHRKLCKSSYF